MKPSTAGWLFAAPALTVIGLFCAMIYLDWQLSLIAFLVAPAAAIPVQRIGRRVRRVATTTQEQIGLMASLISESFGAARMVKAGAVDDAAFAAISLTLTVDIGKTQNDKVKTKRLLIQAQIMFDRDF